MRLPNGDLAIIDIAKVRDYCLSPSHPRGKHKARVFHTVLHLTIDDAEAFRSALQEAARGGEAAVGSSDSYGTRYIIDFEMQRVGRSAIVRSCWIIRSGEDRPRFVTCFVL